MRTHLTPEIVEGANSQFWQQMLGMRLERTGPEEWRGVDDDHASIRHMLGCCELSGAWKGRIEVRLSLGLARAATAAMLMQAPEDVLAEDMLDATKEIANMIAGTIKSALPRPCSMSVPYSAIEDREVNVLTCATGSPSVFFHHESGKLLVRVCEESCEPQPETGPGWALAALEIA